MCDIPLDLQRKFEERWAARFVRPLPPVALKQEPEEQDQQLATRKTPPVGEMRAGSLGVAPWRTTQGQSARTDLEET
jgi:hypothetical protein